MSKGLAMAMLTGSAALAGMAAVATAAYAADNAMKVCGAKYQTAKATKTLPAGETWQQFLAGCRGGAKPVAAKPAPVAVAAKAPARPAAQPLTAGRQAAVARERQCGAQWRAEKAAGKVPANATWPQYWSKCNARMKS